jgi:hypothetical protein
MNTQNHSVESKNQVNSNYSRHLRSSNPTYRAPTVLKPLKESLILLCRAGLMKLIIDYRITLFKWRDRRDDLSNAYIWGTIYVWDGTVHMP